MLDLMNGGKCMPGIDAVEFFERLAEGEDIYDDVKTPEFCDEYEYALNRLRYEVRKSAALPEEQDETTTLIAEVARLQKENADYKNKLITNEKVSAKVMSCVKLAQKMFDRLEPMIKEKDQRISTLEKALVLMGNDLADWMGNGTGEFWAKDYTAQAQEQEGKK